MANQPQNFVPRGTEFHGESTAKFRSPGNGISRRINRKISFPGERNFTANQPQNFVPRGTEFHGESTAKFRSPGNGISRRINRKISFPGERNFTTNQPKNFVPRGKKIYQPQNFVPRGTEFLDESTAKFRSPGNEISRQINRKISFPGERNFSTNQPRNFVPRGTKFSG